MDRCKLIEAGIDYDEGVQRFGSRPEIFEKYLRKFFDCDFVAAISRQLEVKDIPGAFRTTHDLKGATGNLSINRCYAAVCALTEQLRDGVRDKDYTDAFLQVKIWYEKARRAVVETARGEETER